MKTSTFKGKHGIQQIARNQLENFELADNLALLFHTHEQMLMKTTSVASAAFLQLKNIELKITVN
ncbi:unnamed protein product [Schistosoma margrebowiei]|uniref:Uncharacterized protein n=1 Tax=Schistosoma margrebowiei TaxID=48269 RepID=A0A183M730_9TREM|nr:unnamed protein product [Schistosoma margrebowiei]